MQNQITEGPILRPLLFYFFPILLGTFFQQFYNTVDAIIVGNFVGTAALGAVGGATSVIINFLVNLFVGLSSGATVVIARYYGARQGEELRKAVHTAAAIARTAGVLITALGLVLADPVLRLMGTPSDVMGYAQVYLKVYFSGTIASFIYNMGSSVLRAVGDTKRPLYFLIAACMTNIVLDLVFVVAFRWNVFGAALATVLSQVVSAVLVTLSLVRADTVYRIELKAIRFYRDKLRMILAQLCAGEFQRFVQFVQRTACGDPVQYVYPGEYVSSVQHQFLRNRGCSVLDCLWQGRRFLLDDLRRLWCVHYHFCQPELWGREV